MNTTADEERALDAVCARLRARFPATAPDEVQSAVGAVYETFRGARVRDFVPVLVEREARDRLAHSA